MLPGHRLVLLVLLTGCACFGNAWSQDNRASREREALRRAQQQLQQVRQEKAALEEKLAGTEKENAALGQARGRLASQVTRAQASAKASARAEGEKRQTLQAALDAITLELRTMAQDKKALQAQKSELDERLAELQTRQTGLARELAQSAIQRRQTDTALLKQEQNVTSCEDKNLKLYRYGRDLVAQCRDRSASDAVLRLEPFTGIRRVAIENLLEEYRDKLDAQKAIQPK